MTWKSHDETKDKEAPRDFMKLNKNCIKDGKLNARVSFSLSLLLSMDFFQRK